jgi:hypothetical protein
MKILFVLERIEKQSTDKMRKRLEVLNIVQSGMSSTLKDGVCPEYTFLICGNNELPLLARMLSACEANEFPYKLIFIAENGDELKRLFAPSNPSQIPL